MQIIFGLNIKIVYLLTDFQMSVALFKTFGMQKDDKLIFEPRCEKTGIFAYAKTKTQISFAVTAKLISAFVFAT